MEGTKTVKEFVDEYIKLRDTGHVNGIKESFIEDIVIREYAPIDTKNLMAAEIVGQCNRNKNGELVSNSVALDVSYKMSVLVLYTSLKIDVKNMTKEYDTLQEHGLVSSILHELADYRDAQEYSAVFEMVKADYDKNNYSFSGIVRNAFRKLKAWWSKTSKEVVANLEKNPEFQKQMEEFRRQLGVK